MSPNVRCGDGPKDFVPFENSHTYEPIAHGELTVAASEIGAPSAPANGASGAMVGLTLFATSGPIEVMKPEPFKSKAGLVTAAEPMLKCPYSNASPMPPGRVLTIFTCTCWVDVVAGVQWQSLRS